MYVTYKNIAVIIFSNYKTSVSFVEKFARKYYLFSNLTKIKGFSDIKEDHKQNKTNNNKKPTKKKKLNGKMHVHVHFQSPRVLNIIRSLRTHIRFLAVSFESTIYYQLRHERETTVVQTVTHFPSSYDLWFISILVERNEVSIIQQRHRRKRK